jgi:5-deoxy-5-amino-3-dehydroquinate synthase
MTDRSDDDMRVVSVDLGDRRYDVVVGHGARSCLASMLPTTVRRAAVVTQDGIPLEVDPGVPFERFEIGDGEAHKTLATIEVLAHGFAAMGLTRHDVVVGVGGGMVTDVAGFAAASWHRGVPVVHVSTTLVGMVDAAIGGKTGVNLPEGAGVVGGKNLVGAYWQPSAVVCDLDALSTLPEREQRCGRGEMAKYHFLTGEDLLAMPLADRVARCVRIKADVVAGDERESPDNPRGRALLNYGHTLGHALEAATDHALAHGEAVAIGLIYAARLAHHLGRIDDARVGYHYDVVGGAYDLSTRLPAGLDPQYLLALMGRDKKVVGSDGLTFVLDGPSGVETVRGVAPSAALAALGAMVDGG